MFDATDASPEHKRKSFGESQSRSSQLGERNSTGVLQSRADGGVCAHSMDQSVELGATVQTRWLVQRVDEDLVPFSTDPHAEVSGVTIAFDVSQYVPFELARKIDT